ncbi:hypothetical protein [Georgenia faecalis]|uniref:Uncharacterized protein n=1 Tax=Georgenia faecalis TaxID=2483799 RepID=A0ABV9DAH0_9MICO|nr:hypothetical protein [Georgenia faecalis]
MQMLSAADVIRIHEVAMGQLIPAIHNGLPYSGLLRHACWLSYEVGLIADDRLALAPQALSEFSAQIREPGALERLPLARPWKRYVTAVISAGHDAKDVDDLKRSIAAVRRPEITNELEQFLGELLPGFAASSAETTLSASSEDDGGDTDGGGDVDWGEVLEEDVTGAVVGALSGFAAVGVVAVLGGPAGGAATAGATAGAAVVGGVVGSGVEYLERDAVRDAKIAVTESDGNNPWVPGEGADGDGGGRWHDGDGYGFG